MSKDTIKEKIKRLAKPLSLLLLVIFFLSLTFITTEYIEVGSRSFAALITILYGSCTLSFILGRSKKTEGIADIFALLFSASAAYYAIALISIERFSFYPSMQMFNPFMHVYGFLTVFMVYLGVFALFGNAKHAVVFTNIVFTVFAMLNSLCYTYRERAFVYADLSAWKETLKIAGEGYSSGFDAKVYYGIAFIAVATVLIIFILILAGDNIKEERGKRSLSRSLVASRIFSLAAAVLLCTTMYAGDFLKEKNINRIFWDGSSMRESPFLDFCCSIKNSRLERPENYAPDSITLEKSPENKINNQKDNIKPNIIVVMNESYSDMRNVLPIETNINPYEFFDDFKERARWGKLYVSTWAGGTANTEFEFLTACDTAFLPTGMIPYNWYIQSEFPSLFSTLKAQGYSTLTLHPFLSSYWNRERVYEYFGAEESYWDEDYDDSESFRSYVSDKENYRFLIERFEEKEPGKPIFIFNITMQNHGPYTGKSPSNVKIISDEAYPELEFFLNLIRITGEETKKLIDYFRNVEEPTVIVFFGDHLPAIDKNFFEKHAMLCEEEAEESRRIELMSNKYITEYYIWANYEFDLGRAEDISINYLQGEILDFAGLEAPSFIDFLNEKLRKKWPAIVETGCKKADGTWLPFGVSEFWEDEDVCTYYALQYNLIRDIKHRRNDIFYLN